MDTINDLTDEQYRLIALTFSQLCDNSDMGKDENARKLLDFCAKASKSLNSNAYNLQANTIDDQTHSKNAARNDNGKGIRCDEYQDHTNANSFESTALNSCSSIDSNGNFDFNDLAADGNSLSSSNGSSIYFDTVSKNMPLVRNSSLSNLQPFSPTPHTMSLSDTSRRTTPTSVNAYPLSLPQSCPINDIPIPTNTLYEVNRAQRIARQRGKSQRTAPPPVGYGVSNYPVYNQYCSSDSISGDSLNNNMYSKIGSGDISMSKNWPSDTIVKPLYANKYRDGWGVGYLSKRTSDDATATCFGCKGKLTDGVCLKCNSDVDPDDEHETPKEIDIGRRLTIISGSKW